MTGYEAGCLTRVKAHADGAHVALCAPEPMLGPSSPSSLPTLRPPARAFFFYDGIRPMQSEGGASTGDPPNCLRRAI